MPRGGARPGAGRKRLTPVVPVKKPVPKAFAPDGVKAADAPAEWPFGTTSPAELAAPPVVAGEPLSPLDYLVGVVRDESADPKLRIQAAAIAAPFLHPRLTPVGKKTQKQEAAAKAGVSGKFAPAAAPRLVSSR